MSPALLLALLVSAPDPCTDSTYLLLRNRPLASMTDVEREYYLAKDRFCMEMARSERLSPAADSTTAPRQTTAKRDANTDWHRTGKPAAQPAGHSASNNAQVGAPVSPGGVGGLLAGAAALLLVIWIISH